MPKHKGGVYKLDSGRYYNYSTHRLTTEKGYNISRYWRQVKRYSGYTGLDTETSRKYLKGYDYDTRENTLQIYAKELKRRKAKGLKGLIEKIKISKDFKDKINGQNFIVFNSGLLFSFEYTTTHTIQSAMVEAKLMRDYIYDRLQMVQTKKGFGFRIQLKAQKRTIEEESHYFYHDYKKDYEWIIDKVFIVVVDILKRRFIYYKMPSGEIRFRIRKL